MESAAIAAPLSCFIAGTMILSIRLVLRVVYCKHLDLGDYLALLAIFTISSCAACDYILAIWGSSIISPTLRASTTFTPENIRRRTVGSKCLLVARVMQISSCVYDLAFISVSARI
jgi:hypothetical protein